MAAQTIIWYPYYITILYGHGGQPYYNYCMSSKFVSEYSLVTSSKEKFKCLALLIVLVQI
jgi:hypothetical protein